MIKPLSFVVEKLVPKMQSVKITSAIVGSDTLAILSVSAHVCMTLI